MTAFSQNNTDKANQKGEKEWTCGDPVKDLRNGYSYNTVEIGNQCWLAENLNIGIIINGFKEMTNNGLIEKYCYENKLDNCEIFGGLYQWKEMMDYDSTESSRGICPENWHIPSDSEWITLESFADTEPNNSKINWDSIGDRGTDVGSHLKSKNCWMKKSKNTDSLNFTALASGIRLFSGNNFGDLHYLGFYWTSSLYLKENEAFQRIFDYSSPLISRKGGTMKNGRSVRCVKDLNSK